MFSYPSRRNTPLKQNRIPSFLTGLAVAALGALALASSANAASTACPATTTSTPYAAWGDTSSYWLVPDGDFESQPSGWTLAGGASRVAGSDPFAITGLNNLDGRPSMIGLSGNEAKDGDLCRIDYTKAKTDSSRLRGAGIPVCLGGLFNRFHGFLGLALLAPGRRERAFSV